LLAFTEQAERAMQGMGLTLPNVLDSSSLMDRAAEEAAQIAASEARKSKKADKHKKKSKKSKHSKRRQHGSDSESESQSEEQSSEESESSSEDEEEEGEKSHILAEKPSQKSKRELKAAAAEKKAAGGEDVDMTNSKSATRLLFANEVERHFELLWREEREVLSAVFNSSADGGSLCQRGVHLRQQDWRIFFLRVMGVPPNRFRPPVVLSELTFEHAQNHYYKKIIDANADIVQYSDKSRQQLAAHATAAEVAEAAARRKSDLIRVTNAWLELQEAVNCLMDSAKNPNAAAAKSAPSGIKQELERKEGLFRMHMMGKRVNFAARSVISPDPYLHTNEIGIPRRFAMKLTYPQPVNAWNVAEMRQAVVNGPLEYPGANYVQDERGQLINLEALSRDQREALSKMLLTSGSSTAKTQASAGVAGRGGNSVVLRHLRTGDVLLANRQPTLHKPSMMAHKARVLYGEQTIRMHYANCKTYNADFDGDEINLHFPQNELARAELYTIANTDNQYIVPTSGKPIRGLIQDHVGAGVLLTSRDTFFTRHEFQQLLFCACIDANPRVAIRTPPPAILRPRPLWTGKQLFSAVLSFVCDNLPPLTMESGASVPADAWGGKDVGREEAVCTIVKNDLVCGIVDKNQYGASAFGVVHAVYELYGATKAGNLLSALGRLLTAYLQRRGFTCGMDDLVLAADADRNRQAAIAKSDSEGVKAAAKFAECDISAFTAALDDPSAHPELVDKCKRAVSVGLRKKLSQPANAAALDSVMRGALSPTTSTIIKKCLPGGQIKPFPWNCMSVMTLSGAKGSLVNFSQISCLLGQQELEGRRVPVMASGKSLPSFAAFDPSPRAGGYVTQRFLSGIRPQEFYFHCMAGREGLVDTAVKTARSGYLQRCLIKHLESLTVAYDYTVRDGDGSVVQFHYGEDSLDVCKSKYLDKFSFFAKNYQSLLHKLNPSAAISALDVQSVATYREQNADNKKADPLLSVFSPTSCLGATSEKFDKAVQAYIAKNPENLIRSSGNSSKLTADKFQALMSLNYLRAVVDPGEAVGCIAGQSVGEPSTQMTLNTFHLAGHGGRNVTLGIPRLREIVMTASAHISTPSMELKVRVDSGDLKEAAEALSRRLTRLRLSELVDFVSVRESVESSGETGDAKVRAYRLRLNFLPLSDPAFVISKHEVAFREVAAAVETSFVPKLVSFIARQLKKSSTNGAEGAAGVIQSQRVGRMGDGTAAKDRLA
jgi:DNA-directed RNA polymerase I subunit RPA1